MKKITKILALIVLAVSALVLVACKKTTTTTTKTTTTTTTTKLDFGTLTIADITLTEEEVKDIIAVFSVESSKEPISYIFEGNNIDIYNNKVTGVTGNTETVVTARTAHHETTFKVKVVPIEYGTLSIANTEVTFGQKISIIPVFSIEDRSEKIEYTFTGNNIDIENGVITGIVPKTSTIVTATTAHHETTFTVNVNALDGVLTNPNGIQSKVVIPLPSGQDEYVLFSTVDVDTYREGGYTRLSSFAFNASNNSWYNIEMNEFGDVLLYGRFNGIEKYGIHLFNKNDEGIIVNDKIHYTVAIWKKGQATSLFINDKLVCSYNESEMNGYDTLGFMEVTAAADREWLNSGEYKITLSDIYYTVSEEIHDAYAKNEVLTKDYVLESNDGLEVKCWIGQLGLTAQNFVIVNNVTVNNEITKWTRTSAFAFNGSDNSWYNIETDASGNYTLFARFNGVEKYGIHLFNKNDEGIMVNDKVSYKAVIVKQNQETYLFVNDKLVCSFNSLELGGYPRLETFETTACANRDPSPFNISVSTSVNGEYSDIYLEYAEMVDYYKEYGVLKINNIEVTEEDTITITPIFSKEEVNEEISYTFDGNNISIENGVITGLVPNTVTLVKASTAHHEVLFEVRVNAINYGTLSISNVEVKVDETASISYVFSILERAEEITYTFDGNNISIENGEIRGLVAGTVTSVTATTSHHQTTFEVTVVLVQYGDLIINDLTIMINDQNPLSYEFTMPEKEEEINYSFDGNNISIENGVVKGLVAGTVTRVTATTAHHETTFMVTVNSDTIVETKGHKFVTTNGNETKLQFEELATIRGDFLLKATITVNNDITEWTRTSAFAFNGSDNSWYNIETDASGNYTLFARFNGVEKYFIHLFNKNDEGIIVNGHVQYNVALLKKGQATSLFVNGKLVCSFTESEMTGYAKLETLEVTACADRASAAYDVDMLATIHTSVSEDFDSFANLVTTYSTQKLTHLTGGETKYIFGNLSHLAGDFLLESTITVNNNITEWTRTSAFAFNGSGNSWYNIETDGSGNYTLYGCFNGVEKYHIHLFNKNDEGIIVDGHVTYSVALLKKGQATSLFVNGKLVCSFTESELIGYAKLETLEVTACADRAGAAYDVDVVSSLYTSYSEKYSNYANSTKTYGNQKLTHLTGGETKYNFGNLSHLVGDFLLEATITVNNDITEWTRTSAFAFNGSDNSWYNIETDGSGNYTLYARFNGVEKYHIHLFNKNDQGIIVDGHVQYNIALLKKGQATSLFVNGKLVCSFTESEMTGYAKLENLEVTASADRASAAYDIDVVSCLYTSYSETYNNYANITKTYSTQKLTHLTGSETKYIFGNLSHPAGDFLLETTITVNNDITEWTRTSAFAFNGSDNSWYNIETDASGNYTLFARFNGVEKYFIHLFNKNDEGIIVDGHVQYNVALLKKGQATSLFVNGKLVCSFTESEMTGYAKLETLEVTASADRTGAAYDVDIYNITLSSSFSNVYKEYLSKMNILS